jgi:outer membrane biosynthesis protein TonB
MHLEELLATLIAAIKTNTSSVDENNRLLRAQGATASDTPAPAKTTRAKKDTPAAAVEPEPTPEPEPETPAAAVEPEPTPEPEEKDDTDWVAKAKEDTMQFRKDNPDKRAAQVAALNVLFNEFGVNKISAVPADRGKEFYDKLQGTFV